MMNRDVTIRCISLAGSDRRVRMAQQLDAIGLPWSFFDACTAAPAALPYDPARAVAVHGRRLTAGEIGCFASHWSLWHDVAQENGPDMLLVLEDDVMLNPVFFRHLGRIADAAEPFGYLRLYAKVPAGIRREGPFLDRHIARFSGRAYGTQAYLVSRAAARRWLRTITAIERPIDDEMDRYWAHGIPIRAVFPFPVMEIDYGSTIEPKRRTADAMPLSQRVPWEIRKGIEKLRRHMHDLAAKTGIVG